MKMKHFIAIGCSAAMLLVSVQSKAIPAFARTEALPCGACHTAFPALNKFGRAFKLHGYRLIEASQDTKKTDFSSQVNMFPISASIISRPYIKDSAGNTEIRAIHELEIFTGGVFYRNLSGFFEIESEGEDGFGDVLGLAALNYDFSDAAHIQLAFAPSFFADPYSTLASMRRLTASHYSILNSKYGQADNSDKLRHSRQQVSLFGWIAGRVFYNIGIGGLTGDNVANQSTVTFGRLAVDVTPSFMVGAFGLSGSCKTTMVSDFASCQGSTTDRNFSRVGVDSQMDIGALRITGVYLTAKDDLVSSTLDESNTYAYVQAVYFGKAGENLIVPLLRFETSQANDGKDETKRMTVGASYYISENFKTMLEYSNDTSVPAGVSKSSNVTLQVQAAF